MATSSVSTALNIATVASSCKNSRRQPGRVSAANRTITNPQQSSLYQILGIPMGATSPEIKAAYRRLARVLHPDVNGSGREDKGAATAADDFISIQNAYSILRDPKKRADYDRTLFRQRRIGRSTWVLSAGNSYSSYTCRSWETDQCW